MLFLILCIRKCNNVGNYGNDGQAAFIATREVHWGFRKAQRGLMGSQGAPEGPTNASEGLWVFQGVPAGLLGTSGNLKVFYERSRGASQGVSEGFRGTFLRIFPSSTRNTPWMFRNILIVTSNMPEQT